MAIKYLDKEKIVQKVRGKVKISNDEAEIADGAMSNTEFLAVLEQAETEVELDLSERYQVPFQTTDGQAFKKLPDHTKAQLLLLLEHKAVILVLDNNFGYGSVVDAAAYVKNLEKRYDKMSQNLVEKNGKENSGEKGWRRPPLEGLMVSYNNQADNGFLGPVLVTTSEMGDFPQHRINDPSQSLYSGIRDPEE